MDKKTPLPWHAVALFCVIPAVYIFVVEFLFARSQRGSLGSLNTASLRILGAVLLIALFYAFLVWILGRVSAFSRVLVAGPYVGAGVLTFFYLNRWVYSVWQVYVTDAPLVVNLLLLLAGGALGVGVYLSNRKGLLTVAERHPRVIRALAGGIAFFVAATFVFLALRPRELKAAEGATNVAPVSASSRPNIIFVTYDMLESCNASLYGYSENTTPHLVKRKSDLIVFNHLLSVGHNTRSGNTALLTGKSPYTTKVYDWMDHLSESDSRQHIVRFLKRLGYFNVYMGDGYHGNPAKANLTDGFHEVNGKRGESLQSSSSIVRWLKSRFAREYDLLEPILEDYQLNLEATLKISSDLIRRNLMQSAQYDPADTASFIDRLDGLLSGERPFFLRRHAIASHYPFGRKRKFSVFSDLPKDFYVKKKPLRKDQYRGLYLDAYLEIDDEIEQIFQVIEKHHQTGNTLVILTSDHEYKWKNDGIPIFFVMKLPARQGMAIDTPVWSLDIPVTILDVLGVATPSWMEGRSLLPLVDHAPGAEEPFLQRPVHIIQGCFSKICAVSVLKGGVRLFQELRPVTRKAISDSEVPPEYPKKEQFFSVSECNRPAEPLSPSQLQRELVDELRNEKNRIISAAKRPSAIIPSPRHASTGW